MFWLTPPSPGQKSDVEMVMSASEVHLAECGGVDGPSRASDEQDGFQPAGRCDERGEADSHVDEVGRCCAMQSSDWIQPRCALKVSLTICIPMRMRWPTLLHDRLEHDPPLSLGALL